jgi:UV excision repair protein RAD23
VQQTEQSSETVRQLCDMGFPEDQVRAALRAAFNNPERAVEYLMSGIPEGLAAAPPSAATAPGAGAGAGAGAAGDANALDALRNHPQFDALRQLIQSNPAALPAVLQQIGGQSPELLRLIHQNQDQFVQMLNEPIGTRSAGSAPAPGAPAGGAGAAPFDLGMGAGGMPTPQQIQQLVESLTPEQQAQMAAQMGMTPEQLRGLSQMLSNLPPGAMEQMMASMGGGQGGFEGMGGADPQAQRIELTADEAAAVDRLCDLGFDRTEAIQAYLACDKNEALAANFLMDSAENFGAGGGAGGGDDNDDIYG